MELISLFTTISIQLWLPPGLLESVCWVETKHDVSAYHPNDGGTPSIGICQVKHSTCKWLGFNATEKDLMHPKTNIQCAGAYLKYQIKRYGDYERAVIAYNQGRAGKKLTSTRYSAKVISRWAKAKGE